MITAGEIKMRCLEEAKCGNRVNKGKCFPHECRRRFVSLGDI